MEVSFVFGYVCLGLVGFGCVGFGWLVILGFPYLSRAQ